MRYYQFTVGVGESQRFYVQGNFVAYYSVSAGAAAPAVEVKSGSRGHSVILKPGETVTFPETQTELAVANYDGANTITGVLFVGEGNFVSNRIDGTVVISL